MSLDVTTTFDEASASAWNFRTLGNPIMSSNGSTAAAANCCTDHLNDELTGISLKYSGIALVPVGIALTLVTIVTAVGNLLVGMALVRYRQLRTISNCLIGNLAVSDFLLAVTVLPLSATYECLGYWVFGRIACKTWLVIDVLYCTASIWNLCVIAADRFTATMYPLWYRDRRSASRAIVYVAVVWVVAGATCVPPLIGWTGENYKFDDATSTYQCTPFQDSGYVVYSASTSFFIPFLVTCALYTWIFVVLRQRVRAMRARRQSAALAPSREAAAAAAAAKQQGLSTTLCSTMRLWTTRCWTALKSCRCRHCLRPNSPGSSPSPTGLAHSQLGRDDSSASAAKSAVFSECSEVKLSPVDKQVDLGWNSIELPTNELRSRSAFASSSGHTNNNKKRFRYTIAGRHAVHSLRPGTSLTTSDRRPEIWSLTSGGCDMSLVTNAADCFRSSACGDGVTSNAVHFDENCFASSGRRRKSEDISGTRTTTTSLGIIRQNANGNKQVISNEYTSSSPDGAASSGSSSPSPTHADNGVSCGVANGLPIEDDLMSHSTGNDVNDTERPVTINVVSTPSVALLRQTSEVKASKTACEKTDQKNCKTFLSTVTSTASSVQSKQRDRSERREMRATIRMAVIIGVFGAMWIGFFVLYVINGVTSGSYPVPPALDAFIFWLGYANSTINPILYAVFNVDFRRAFIGIITGCCCFRCCNAKPIRGAGPRRKSSRLQAEEETKLDFRSALGLRRHVSRVTEQFTTATGDV